MSDECASEKKFENWSKFSKDMHKNNLPCFLLAHSAHYLYRFYHSLTSSTVTAGCRMLHRLPYFQAAQLHRCRERLHMCVCPHKLVLCRRLTYQPCRAATDKPQLLITLEYQNDCVTFSVSHYTIFNAPV